MTRFGQFFFHALAISLVNTPAMAFSQKDNLECSQPSSPDQQVAACTRALNAGGLTAIGHTIFLSNRGNAWLDKHLPDRAISDFDEALRFTPKHAFALNGRGNAWRVKGDYDRAIADLTLCISLIPKAAIPVYPLVDAKIAVDRDIQFEAVTLDQVLATVEGAKKIKIVMLDACRDNPFNPRRTAAPDAVAATALTAGAPIASRSIRRGLGEVKVTGATLVVYAAKNGQVALDGDGGNSPFAIAVIQRVATPGVEINKLFRLVRDDVMEATAGRQEPYTYGSLPGKEDFFFVAK